MRTINSFPVFTVPPTKLRRESAAKSWEKSARSKRGRSGERRKEEERGETRLNRPRKSGLIRTVVYIPFPPGILFARAHARVNCNNGRMQNRCRHFPCSNVTRITRGLTGMRNIARTHSPNCAARGICPRSISRFCR